MIRDAILAFGVLAAIASPGPSPAKAQFYDKKTLTMVVNYASGGNADLSARIFQTHLRSHLPVSTILIQNMPGAGGALAMNSLGLGIGSFKPDGLSIGFFGLNPPAEIAGDPGHKVSLDDFEFIGAVRDWNVAFVRRDAIPGITRPEEVMKAKELFIGGYSRSNANDVRSQLSLKVLGVPYKLITGFPGTADLNKALLQGEINFANSALPGYMRQTLPQVISTGIGLPLYYFPVTATDGKLGKVGSLERMGIPSFSEVYERVHGVPPSGPDFEALLLMCDLDSAMHGVIVAPKKAPKAAIDELRAAFGNLYTDQAFQDEYEHATGEKPELVSYTELEPLLKRFKSVPEEMKTVFRQMIQE
jgi:tripartite-type tricarboxylate transporter receptor subunit TctC